jgi:hypothetical protein
VKAGALQIGHSTVLIVIFIFESTEEISYSTNLKIKGNDHNIVSHAS